MTTDILVTEAGVRLAEISGTLRNTGSGWAALSNTGHEPSGIAAVETLPDRLRVHYTFTAAKVRGLLVGLDETFASLRLWTGASVGLAYADVLIYNDTGLVDPSALVSPTGNLWLAGRFRL